MLEKTNNLLDPNYQPSDVDKSNIDWDRGYETAMTIYLVTVEDAVKRITAEFKQNYKDNTDMLDAFDAAFSDMLEKLQPC